MTENRKFMVNSDPKRNDSTKSGIAGRKARQRAEREDRIIATARAIAEREGWSAVTVRRLADEIEYSQPVLYSHFKSRDAIVGAVAVEGFRELAAALRAAPRGSTGPCNALERVAMAYLAFASRHPALYEAMFVLPTGLHFAKADTRPELHEGFDSLVAVVAPFCASTDAEDATETFWAALHGLTELERAGRVRPAAHIRRVRLVVRAFVGLGKTSADHSS
jgi:AcrR family transcriptional regulator